MNYWNRTEYRRKTPLYSVSWNRKTLVHCPFVMFHCRSMMVYCAFYIVHCPCPPFTVDSYCSLSLEDGSLCFLDRSLYFCHGSLCFFHGVVADLSTSPVWRRMKCPFRAWLRDQNAPFTNHCPENRCVEGSKESCVFSFLTFTPCLIFFPNIFPQNVNYNF